ncbi:MAG: DJ-1/PfpI family protein [Mycobacteriaceae bacterium]
MGHINILFFEGVEELDAIGPWEVFSAWCSNYPEDGWTVSTMSESGLPVVAAKGLTLVPHHRIVDAPKADILIYPGGIGTRTMLTRQDHCDWLVNQAECTAVLASVCTGALVLAAAGLLQGRTATTHWMSYDALSELDPSITVDRQSRFVDSGNIVTSAGVSAGIDMSLALIARFVGTDRAGEVKKYIAY